MLILCLVLIHSEWSGACVHGIDVYMWPTFTIDSLAFTHQWFYNRRFELVGAADTQTRPYDYALHTIRIRV